MSKEHNDLSLSLYFLKKVHKLHNASAMTIRRPNTWTDSHQLNKDHMLSISFSLFDRSTLKWSYENIYDSSARDFFSLRGSPAFRNFTFNKVFLNQDCWSLPLKVFVSAIRIDALHLIKNVRFTDDYTANLVIQLYLLQSKSSVMDLLKIAPRHLYPHIMKMLIS